MGNKEIVKRVIHKGLEKGIVLDDFLFCDTAFRISPPLTITREEIMEVCGMLIETLEEVKSEA
jgi:4-aminobutyrate aminotransferase-like enzyme